MTVNQQFRRSSEIQQNVDYVTFASGLGVKTLYGSNFANSAALEYKLVETQQPSDVILTTSGAYTSTSMIKALKVNFDYPIKSQRVIDGTGTFHYSFGVQDNAVGGTATAFTKIILKKLSAAGDETDLVTGFSPVIIAPANDLKSRQVANQIIVPRTAFGSGDSVRVTAEIWGKTSEDTFNVALGSDPSGRDSDNASIMSTSWATTFIVNLPFKPTF